MVHNKNIGRFHCYRVELKFVLLFYLGSWLVLGPLKVLLRRALLLGRVMLVLLVLLGLVAGVVRMVVV